MRDYHNIKCASSYGELGDISQMLMRGGLTARTTQKWKTNLT